MSQKYELLGITFMLWHSWLEQWMEMEKTCLTMFCFQNDTRIHCHSQNDRIIRTQNDQNGRQRTKIKYYERKVCVFVIWFMTSTSIGEKCQNSAQRNWKYKCEKTFHCSSNESPLLLLTTAQEPSTLSNLQRVFSPKLLPRAGFVMNSHGKSAEKGEEFNQKPNKKFFFCHHMSNHINVP